MFLNDIIGGTFGSRINMNLREDKHWSYGSFSFFFDAKGQSPFVALAPVQTDKTKESLAETSRELHEIVGPKPVTADELARGQMNKTLALAGSHETINSVGSAINDLVAFGFPDDYYDTYASRIKALRTSDIQDAGQSVLHPDQLVWVVVGDRSKIEAGIRELYLGEIRFIDAEGKPL